MGREKVPGKDYRIKQTNSLADNT